MPNAAIQNNLYFLCENPNWFFCRIADLEKQLEEAREGTGEESLGEENATLKKKIETLEENKKKIMEVIKKAKQQVEEKTEEKKKDDLSIKALKAQLEAATTLIEQSAKRYVFVFALFFELISLYIAFTISHYCNVQLYS